MEKVHYIPSKVHRGYVSCIIWESEVLRCRCSRTISTRPANLCHVMAQEPCGMYSKDRVNALLLPTAFQRPAGLHTIFLDCQGLQRRDAASPCLS